MWRILTAYSNAVELIVSIIALADNQILIVQTSLIGSMLSNLLLVMGMCFFFGGLKRLEQHFNVTVAQTASSLLALAIASLIIPTAFALWAPGGETATQGKVTDLSRGTSILLLLVYAAYLYFQLGTHAQIYNAPSKKVAKRSSKHGEGDAKTNFAVMGAGLTSVGGEAEQRPQSQHDDESDADEPKLHIWVAVATLAISTVFVALCAEFMVDSIDALTDSGAISKTFVGLILLPIVGNAAEHATAVTVACKDKMDLAIGVAVGSSMQIALLVLPLVVILGWILNKPMMDLSFDGFQIAVLFVAGNTVPPFPLGLFKLTGSSSPGQLPNWGRQIPLVRRIVTTNALSYYCHCCVVRRRPLIRPTSYNNVFRYYPNTADQTE